MKICLIIYKIDPVLGSEDASGYHLAKEIVKTYRDATLITRSNNIAALQADPAFHNINLVGVDVPRALSFYKKQGRGIILYYYLWQIFAAAKVKKLQLQKPFDLIHQINFHADWAPHFLHKFSGRIIWGPVLHHPMVPFSWFPYGFRKLYLKEMIAQTVKLCFWRLNPALRRAIRATRYIIFGNDQVPKPYRRQKAKLVFQAYAGSHWPIVKAEKHINQFHLLYVGRMITLKGPHLALDAYEQFLKHIPLKHVVKPHFTLIGRGHLDDIITRKVERLRQIYGDVVTLHDWMDREHLPEFYQKADFMLYPSLESQGLVVGEAISQNCPVITLSGTGPAFVAQSPLLTVHPRSRNYTVLVIALAQKIRGLYDMKENDPLNYQTYFDNALKRAEDLRWSAIAKNIMKTYTA
ncbi:MAG TPA: glycosyltransferase family 4 protein [Alphaproteobacteria bacterium]